MEHTSLIQTLETLERESTKDSEDAQLATMMRLFIREEIPKFKSYLRRVGAHHLGKTVD